MGFFIWRKNNVSLSRYRDFCAFANPTDFKICDDIINIAAYASCCYAYCFWILSSIKMKLGHILVSCMTNISNMILAGCWRLETSCKLFYDFVKMIIMAVFNGWHIPFLIVLFSPFQKRWNTGILTYLVIE